MCYGNKFCDVVGICIVLSDVMEVGKKKLCNVVLLTFVLLTSDSVFNNTLLFVVRFEVRTVIGQTESLHFSVFRLGHFFCVE